MIEVAITIEGQEGLNWPRWQRIAQAVEDLGFAGLYRSDHYTNHEPPDRDSLELWVSLTWLASHTKRIEFGSMVSPVTFRQPTMTARMASAVDDLSGGRLTLGLGAGWNQREHHNYGWPLPPMEQRIAQFEEALQIITRLFNQSEPVTLEGEYYRIEDAVLLPRPARPGGPRVLVGGTSAKRTLPLVAKYASEWNGNVISPARYAWLNGELNRLLAENGRNPASVRRSLTTNIIYGKDQAEVDRKLQATGKTIEQLKERGTIIGTGPAVVEQLQQYQEAGAQRVILQWLNMDDLDGLENLAKDVLS